MRDGEDGEPGVCCAVDIIFSAMVPPVPSILRAASASRPQSYKHFTDGISVNAERVSAVRPFFTEFFEIWYHELRPRYRGVFASRSNTAVEGRITSTE